MKVKFKIFLLTFGLLATFSMQSQNMASRWFFGNRAGLHFTSTGVQPDSGAMNTLEGCASLSDLNGNILFYSNGLEVYDASHNVMPNSTGLLGDSSSTQSAIFVPKPGVPGHFFIFTSEKLGTDSIHYSEIDMSLNGGLGDVVATVKNIALAPDSAAEKLTAAQHANSTDFWVIAHGLNDNNFYTYLVTNAGVNPVPVISSTGPLHDFSSGQGAIGYMRMSPDGKTIALARNIENEVDILSFDNSTGAVNYQYTLADTVLQPSIAAYGVEFSPNGQLLYVSDWEDTTIRQYNLTAGNAAAVEASKFVLNIGSGVFGALQLGPDGKIYVSQKNAQFISRINHPDVPGPGCTYEHEAVQLLNNTNCRTGLPNFNPSFLDPQIHFDSYCAKDTIQFSTNVLASDSLRWFFGDTASGNFNTSVQPSPVHLFSDTGNFRVSVLIYNGGFADTIYRDILIFPAQVLNLGNDTAICTGTSLSIGQTASPFSTYAWNTGQNTSLIAVSAEGEYVLTAFGMCDTVTDTIFVRVDDTVQVSLGSDTTACVGDVVAVAPETISPGSFLWSTGATDQTITATVSGLYALTFTNGCGSSSDSQKVSFISGPVIDFPGDTVVCGDPIFDVSQPGGPGVTYIWNDFSTGASHTVDSSQTVWVVATGNCGTASDTFDITFVHFEYNFPAGDTMVCAKDSLVLTASAPNATYLWNTDDTTTAILAPEEETYSVTVTSGTCTESRSIRIEQANTVCEGVDCYIEFPNVITPNADGINDLFLVDTDCSFGFYALRIYNRWGTLVHASDKANGGWDGYSNGELVPEGVYFYILDYKHNVVVDADRDSYSGSLSVFH